MTVIRLFSPETDFSALLDLITAIEAFDQVGEDVTEATLRSRLSWRDHNPSRDRWLAVAPGGATVGHAWIFRQSAQRAIISAAVHPDWRRQGIGSALLAEAAARAHEYHASQIVSGAEAVNLPGQAFLHKHGFIPAGNARRFTAPADAPLADPILPDGYTLRTQAEMPDLNNLAAACTRCYHDMWGHRENFEPATPEHFQENINRIPYYFFPDGIFLLFAPDGDIAGVCYNRLIPAEENQPGRMDKIIDSPGVAPAHRHLDLQRPLVQASMRWLADRAAGEYTLETWGDSDRAVEIYHALGFSLEPRNHFIEYLLATPGGSE